MKKQTTALCAATLSLFLLFSLASSDYESYSNDYSDDISNGNYADSDTKAASTTTTAETTKKRLVTPCEFTQDNVVVYIEAEYLDSIPNDDFGLYTLPSGYKYLVLGIVFENHTDSDIFVSTSDFSVYADNSLCSEKIIMVDGVDTMATKGAPMPKKEEDIANNSMKLYSYLMCIAGLAAYPDNTRMFR